MANISNYLEAKLLEHTMKNTAYSSPAAVYLGLVTSTATDLNLEEGVLTNEVTAYTGDRKAITFGTVSQVNGKATLTTTAPISFEGMPAATVKYAIIVDAATTKGSTGNILYWCPLTANKTTNLGDTFTIPTGDLTIDLD